MASRGPRVLLVDDEPQIRRLVGMVIERALGAPAEVIYAGDGKEAMDALVGGPEVDAIICDIVMPRHNGLDLLRWLERHRRDLVAHTVFVTGGAGPELERQLSHRPIVYKPLNRSAIQQALTLALKGCKSTETGRFAAAQTPLRDDVDLYGAPGQ